MATLNSITGGLLAALVLSLAACGGGGGSEAPAQSSDPPIVAPTTSTPATFLNVPPNVEGWNDPTVVLAPSQPWEFTSFSTRGAVYEPSVLYDSLSGTYTMWYSGGWETCSTGTATSIDGVHWTKNPTNPLIGQGKMGITWACRNTVLRVNGETYVYFNSPSGTKSAIFVTHSQDGVTNLSTPQVLLLSGDIDQTVANSWAVALPSGIVRFFYDSLTAEGTWQAFSARCDGPLGPCYKDPVPLKGLQTGSGSYGGGWTRYLNGRWDTYYLAGPNGVEGGHVPTYLYHACDASAHPVAFGNGGNPLFSLPSGFDQHGDPFVIDGSTLPDGQSRIWFDRVDNPHGYADILLSTRPTALPSTCP